MNSVTHSFIHAKLNSLIHQTNLYLPCSREDSRPTTSEVPSGTERRLPIVVTTHLYHIPLNWFHFFFFFTSQLSPNEWTSILDPLEEYWKKEAILPLGLLLKFMLSSKQALCHQEESTSWNGVNKVESHTIEKAKLILYDRSVPVATTCTFHVHEPMHFLVWLK